MCAQLLLSLDCLHQSGILHRDLKPGNILKKSKEPDELDIVLADFGFAI
jgi:serine/threonine protein kinase